MICPLNSILKPLITWIFLM